MPRDYARSNKREKKPGQLPGWAWMLGGLAIGLFVAFLVYLNNTSTPNQKNALVKAFKDTMKDTREVKQEKEPAPPPPPAKTPVQSAEKPKPSFDFYYILPELEVAVPEQEIAAKSQKPNAADEKVEYILQAGSFREHGQADQLKAKLALQGLDANIQSVQINQDTWYRVRIGPITNIATLNSTLKRLKENNISAIVVKSKT